MAFYDMLSGGGSDLSTTTDLITKATAEETTGVYISQFNVATLDSDNHKITVPNEAGAGIVITNNSGSSVTIYFQSQAGGSGTGQAGVGTGSLPTMITTGANRESYFVYYPTTTVSSSLVIPNGKKGFIGGAVNAQFVINRICYFA